jgi:hypothetical protein
MAAHPEITVPLVRDAFKEEWTAEEGRVSYFLYRFAQNATVIPARLQEAIFQNITRLEPKQINTLDRGLDIVRNLSLSEAQHATLRTMAKARFTSLRKSQPLWAARYVALVFLLDGASAAALLMGWLRTEKPAKRKKLAITVLGLLFGNHHPLVAGILGGTPVPSLKQLLLLAYQEVRPDEDHVHEGSYTPDDRDHAETARNAILKALIDTEGEAAFRAMMRLADHRDMKLHRIRFRELARRMAERDADVIPWRPGEMLTFERDKLLPVKSGAQFYALICAVINEIGWDFKNADSSARAVLEAARNENAVQEWLATEIRQRSKGRYHATRESEIAEGNMPDMLVSAIGIVAEVAVEAKHGGKDWSTKKLEDSLRRQLAEDYLRPATRRHGVFVVTNHGRRGWTNPATRRRLTFVEMIAYLNGVAATLTRNSTGDIAVTVIGIDAVKPPRTRTRDTSGNKPKKRATRRPRQGKSTRTRRR